VVPDPPERAAPPHKTKLPRLRGKKG